MNAEDFLILLNMFIFEQGQNGKFYLPFMSETIITISRQKNINNNWPLSGLERLKSVSYIKESEV